MIRKIVTVKQMCESIPLEYGGLVNVSASTLRLLTTNPWLNPLVFIDWHDSDAEEDRCTHEEDGCTHEEISMFSCASRSCTAITSSTWYRKEGGFWRMARWYCTSSREAALW